MNGLRSLQLHWLGARIAGRISRRLVGALTWRLWFTPWRVPESERTRAREAAWLAGTTPLAVPFGGGTLRGFSAGDGPTVLLVHGWGDRASRLGALVQPLVAAGFRVAAVDLPAHGDSPGRRTDVYDVAEALQATAAHLGDVAAVVAHSMGALETVFALHSGLRAERVALLAPAVRLDHAMEPFAQMFRLPAAAMDDLRRRIERRYGATVWTDVAADLLAARLRLPALIVHDVDDPQVAFADGELLARVWPGARLVRTQGLGHDRILRDEGVLREVVSFLQQGRAEQHPRPAAIPARVR